MRQDIATQWVAALRSGTYKQGTKKLRSAADRYCCLGVLCELLTPDTATLTPDGWQYDGEICFLTKKVARIAGLYRADGYIRPGVPLLHVKESLAEANDAGATFAEIADYIEQHWEKL